MIKKQQDNVKFMHHCVHGGNVYDTHDILDKWMNDNADKIVSIINVAQMWCPNAQPDRKFWLTIYYYGYAEEEH